MFGKEEGDYWGPTKKQEQKTEYGLGGGLAVRGALANSPDIPAVTGPLWPLQLLLRSRQTAVDARTEDGTTALMLAARLAVEDLVEELIAAQADVGARDKWGMDLEKLMLCYRETEQMGCEVRSKKWGGGGFPLSNNFKN